MFGLSLQLQLLNIQHPPPTHTHFNIFPIQQKDRPALLKGKYGKVEDPIIQMVFYLCEWWILARL